MSACSLISRWSSKTRIRSMRSSRSFRSSLSFSWMSRKTSMAVLAVRFSWMMVFRLSERRSIWWFKPSIFFCSSASISSYRASSDASFSGCFMMSRIRWRLVTFSSSLRSSSTSARWSADCSVSVTWSVPLRSSSLSSAIMEEELSASFRT